MTLSPAALDWKAAADLVATLRAGGHPPVADAGPWVEGEPVHALLPVRVLRMQGQRLAFATSDASTHAAAAHWVEVDRGQLVVTPVRGRVIGRDGEVDLIWAEASRVWSEHDGNVFCFPSAQLKLAHHAPVWVDVLVNFVAYGRVVEQPMPEWVVRALWKESWRGHP